MRLLLLIDNLGAGGAQRQFVGLAAMLKKNNHEVLVITYQDVPFFLPYLQEHNVDYKWIQKASKKSTRIYFVYKAIREYKPDWVISYLDTPCIIACICKMLGLRFKLLVSERNTTQNKRKESFKFWLFRIANVIVTNAYSQKSFIDSHYPKLSSRTHAITNFVDTDYFICGNEKISHSIPKIVVIATIWPSKNTLSFIDAVMMASMTGVQFEIHWYGLLKENQDYIKLCQEKIEKHDLSNQIKLFPKTTHIKPIYCDADYFCLPSLYEGTPNSLCEAMSCGLPVICSNVCDNPRFVKEGLNGYLFDPRSVHSMAEAISRILKVSKEEYRKFSKKSREIAEELCSKEVFLASYISLLK